MLRIENMLKSVGSLSIRGVHIADFFTPVALAAFCGLIGTALLVRHRIYATVAEESATLGKEVLKQNR